MSSGNVFGRGSTAAVVLFFASLLIAACSAGNSAATTTVVQATTTTPTAPPTTVTITTTTTSTTTTTVPPTTMAPVPASPATDALPIDALDTDPLTLAEFQDKPIPEPEGYLALRVAAPPGEYGSYAIAPPAGWLWWLPPGDPATFVAVADEKDLSASRKLLIVMNESNEDYASGLVFRDRGMFIDEDAPYLLYGQVRISSGVGLDVDSLLEAIRETYSDTGVEILRLEAFPADGGGSVELKLIHDPDDQGYVEGFVQNMSFVLDIANETVWGVVCQVHESGAAESDEACWSMIRSFRPFGPIDDY